MHYCTNQQKRSIRGIWDELKFTLGTTILPLEHDGVSLSHQFHVVSEGFATSTAAVLRRDFLQYFRDVINYEDFTISLNKSNQRLVIPIAQNLEDDSIILPPPSEVFRCIRKLCNVTEDTVIQNEEIPKRRFRRQVNHLKEFLPKIYDYECNDRGLETG